MIIPHKYQKRSTNCMNIPREQSRNTFSFYIRLGGPRTLPSDTHKHAPFPRTANSPSRLNSVVTEQNSETEFKVAAPIVT